MHLFAAVPSHNGTIVLEGTQTLLQAQHLVLSRGGSFQLHYVMGTTISIVRNAIVDAFLQSEADLLLMLDSDQAISPEGFAKMIDLNQPVVGCMYPRRRYNWANVRLDTVTNIDQVLYQASEYFGSLALDEKGEAQFVNGFARAEYAGTGILLLRREVFHQLMKHFPELKGRGLGRDAYPEGHGGQRWGFFNEMQNEEGITLTEDISFCRRWRQTGGEIWIDGASEVLHIGRAVHSGNFLAWHAANHPS